MKYKLLKEGAGIYTILNHADITPDNAFSSGTNERQALINHGGILYRYKEKIDDNNKYKIYEFNKSHEVGENFYIKYKNEYALIFIDSIASVLLNWRLWAGLNIEVEKEVYVVFEDSNIRWENAELIFTN